MSLSGAIDNLAEVLSESRFIERVDELPLKPGSRSIAMSIEVGDQTSVEMFGKVKTIQNLILTLTIKIKLPSATISDILREIDQDIIRDRRRDSEAQTTVLGLDGWTKEESEGKQITVIKRDCEVHYYADQV